MAEVFRAKAFGVEGFERLVAVKRILPNIAEDKEFIRMFIEEAKLSVQLNHANIAQIFDLGVVDASYYIALEHVHGRDLRVIFDRCRTVGEAMPVAQACFVVMKLCEGLDYAHNKRDQQGRELSLVHRDVSPQNVLVSFEGEVKIIDFGIAKAAGKGSKTQAGILKGKFGYMSPEQVRGLPVDRRSDVFSCGIVLYELLTGERLFVGESDFSTLEKVRNVEILPPSTYNRKIPDELERIVLKALAKDTEERYQNAIDLHDELQAFVYTAGEFYSRKDLAGWMKKTFTKEIEEETAKLETYRQLKSPTATGSQELPRQASGSKPPGPSPTTPPPRRTGSLPAAGTTKPPPPPPSRSSQQLPVVAAKKPSEASGELSWDEDELETQIYDNPEDDPKNKPAGRTSKPLPLQAPSASQPLAAAASQDAGASGPDLSSLVSSTAKSWEQGGSPAPGSTLNGMGATGSNGHSAPAKFPTGSNKAVAPEPPPPRTDGGLFDNGSELVPTATHMPQAFSAFSARDKSAPFDPMASFGEGVIKRQARPSASKRGVVLIAVGGALAAAAAVVAVIVVTNKGDSTPEPAATKPAIVVEQPPPPPVADQNTGFDLYVTPAGITQWKLDAEARTDRLPSRIRGITPGRHSVQIDPPAGFLGQTMPVTVEAGKAPKVEITLQPIEGLKGHFESNPPGATISLIIDGTRQTLGAAPQVSPLDPRKSYQVLFEKPGYVSVNRPLVFTGVVDEKLVVTLEKAAAIDTSRPRPRPTPPVGEARPKPADPKPGEIKTEPKPGEGETKPEGESKPKPTGEPKPAGNEGVLTLGSKPPCDIYIDGADSGLHTPQREIKLPAGKHRITLVNNEFGIKETFSVDIKAGEAAKAIKDFSDRLPK